VEQSLQAFSNFRNQLIMESQKELAIELFSYSIIESPAIQGYNASDYQMGKWIVPCTQGILERMADYQKVYRIVSGIIRYLEKKFPDSVSVVLQENMEVKILMALMFHLVTKNDAFQNMISAKTSQDLENRADAYDKFVGSYDYYELLSNWSGKKIEPHILYQAFYNVIEGIFAFLDQKMDAEVKNSLSTKVKLGNLKINIIDHCRVFLKTANLEKLDILEPLPPACKKEFPINYGSLFSK
jgi:hypothetical protein